MTRKDPLWQVYEREVKTLLASMDDNATVVHNESIIGRLSGKSRQVDVLAVGMVVGQKISIAVECKRYHRSIGIGVVDQFVGKLLDLGVERGVLYSYLGFTGPAVSRAFGAVNPSVLPVALQVPEGAPEKETALLYRALAVGPVDPIWPDEFDMPEYRHFLQTGRWW
jgi:hypothetical protein